MDRRGVPDFARLVPSDRGGDQILAQLAVRVGVDVVGVGITRPLGHGAHVRAVAVIDRINALLHHHGIIFVKVDVPVALLQPFGVEVDGDPLDADFADANEERIIDHVQRDAVERPNHANPAFVGVKVVGHRLKRCTLVVAKTM